MVGITQKSNVASFPFWSLIKQNSWVTRSNKKDIVGIIISVFIYNEELEIN